MGEPITFELGLQFLYSLSVQSLAVREDPAWFAAFLQMENSFVSWCKQNRVKVMITLRAVRPFGFSSPHWCKKNFIEAHMKFTNSTEIYLYINIFHIFVYKFFMISVTRDNKKCPHKIRVGYCARWFDYCPLRKACFLFLERLLLYLEPLLLWNLVLHELNFVRTGFWWEKYHHESQQ